MKRLLPQHWPISLQMAVLLILVGSIGLIYMAGFAQVMRGDAIDHLESVEYEFLELIATTIANHLSEKPAEVQASTQQIITALQVGEDHLCFLVDQDGTVIAHPDEDVVGQNLSTLSPTLAQAASAADAATHVELTTCCKSRGCHLLRGQMPSWWSLNPVPTRPVRLSM